MFRDPDPANRARPGIECQDGRTKSDMRDESDINLIMAKYRKTGMVNFVNQNQAEYMEVGEIDFHEAMNRIANAKSMFAQMPAHVRKEFKNDPGNFLEFVNNPENLDEAIEMGLLDAPEGYVKPIVEPAQQEPETASVGQASTPESGE